jgi:hypothetical protein
MILRFVLAVLAALGIGLQPVPIGSGPSFRPPPGAHAIRGLRCTSGAARRYGVHLELFTAGRAVVVPAGIGIGPPLRREGAYVRGGRCSFPVRTREPTGVLEIERRARLSLGQLFAVWGHPLPRAARVYVDGVRSRDRAASVPLRRHSEIVVETGPFVRPHSFYRFPKGL